MSDLANEVETYKVRSRRFRNRALTAIEEGDAEQARMAFEKSRGAIKEALRYLQELGAPDPEVGAEGSESETEVAKQLADCWGVLGGVWRAQGELASAREAYDKGYRYESSRRFNILATYNRVNRLIVRILQNPELLADPPPLITDMEEHERKTMPELLGEAAEEIKRQMHAGRQDKAWAAADLAMVRLLGGLRGVDIALNDLEESSVNDPFPKHSMLKVLRELAARQLPMKDDLLAVAEQLRGNLPPTMQGDPLISSPLPD